MEDDDFFLENMEEICGAMELETVLTTEVLAGQVMFVTAAAGAGKTTMLREYALRRPSKKFMYLTYNKSVQVEQQIAFAKAGARNVTIMTLNGICFKATLGTHLSQIRKKPLTSLAHVKSVLGDNRGLPQAEAACRVLREFCESADDRISTSSYAKDPIKKQAAIDGAEKLFRAMTTKGSYATHETYTKQFALSVNGHDFYFDQIENNDVFEGFDIVMIDEAQDLNDAQLSVLLRPQIPFGLVVVYDRHQTIYQHVGAQGGDGLLGQYKPTYERTLSRSFRFGAPLDTLATSVIRFFKHDSAPEQSRTFCVTGAAPWKQTIVTTDFTYETALSEETHPYAALVDAAEASSKAEEPRKKRQVTVIGRHNATLFAEVARVVETYPQYQIHFAGGLANACGDGGFAPLVDLSHFCSNKRYLCQSRTLRHWRGSLQAFQSWAERGDRSEFMRPLAVVENMGHDRVLRVVDRVNSVNTDNPDDADIIFSTVHKAKGLGWPQVYILGDLLGGNPNKTIKSTFTTTTRKKKSAYYSTTTSNTNNNNDVSPPSDWDWVGPGGANLDMTDDAAIAKSLFDSEIEPNICYTALTRAKAVLYLHPTTAAWLRPVALEAAKLCNIIPECLLPPDLEEEEEEDDDSDYVVEVTPTQFSGFLPAAEYMRASPHFQESELCRATLDDDFSFFSPAPRRALLDRSNVLTNDSPEAVDVVRCCSCRQPHDGKPMIGCAGENCPIGWFHARCVGELPVDHDDPWLCPHCATPSVSNSPSAAGKKSPHFLKKQRCYS